jgi:DNA-binding NarL/FixJ family response regulator
VIRALVIDDEALVRAGLRLILESAGDITVVGEADDGDGAVEAVRRCRPDCVLMYILMPELDGIAATVVRRLDDPPPVVILTFDLDDYVFRALQAGADGFLLKDTPPLELMQAVRSGVGESMLSLGGATADRPLRQRRAARPRGGAGPAGRPSPRELEVCIEVGRGRSNAEIGASLFMSEATVKAHVSRLLVKLGVATGYRWRSSPTMRPGPLMGLGRPEPEQPRSARTMRRGLYRINDEAVARATQLIDAHQYVLDSDWGDAQPNAEDENRCKSQLVERDAPPAPRPDRGRQRRDQAAQYVVYGDLRRVHRSGLIACVSPGLGVAARRSSWPPDLLQHLDKVSA